MKLAAVGLVAAAAFALSAGTASAQYVVRGGHTHGGGYAQPAPSYGGYGNYGGGYGGYAQPAPSYGNYGGSGYAPNYGGGYTPAPRGHYDYVPGHFDRHRGHYDYHPGHYDYHRNGTRGPRH